MFSCCLALSLDAATLSCASANLDHGLCPSVSFTLFGLTFPTVGQLGLARDIVYTFMLCFPLIFVLGLLPQVNTNENVILYAAGCTTPILGEHVPDVRSRTD